MSQQKMGQVAEHISNAFGKVNFLQIGGNDGVVADPISETARNGQWFGQIFEPVPQYFDLLRKNYSGCSDRITLRNEGVSDQATSLTIYFVMPDKVPGGRKWIQGIASLDKAQLLRVIDDENLISEATVPVVDVNGVLEDLGAAKLDLVVMDVEGHEPVILDRWDFDLCRPTLFCYEFPHMDTDKHAEIIKKFKANGYILFRDRPDMIAVHSSAPTELMDFMKQIFQA